jgi:UDP-N-acetylglucosamine 2-epimerase
VPCTTIREETEWPETLKGDWNVLAGSRLDELPSLVTRDPQGHRGEPYGDGNAAERIVGEVSIRIS